MGSNKNKTRYLLIVICIMQLAVAVFYGSKKSWLFTDEVFSYASANHAEGVYVDFPEYEWQDEQWYIDYMSAESGHRFEYSVPYRNQIYDVHPPLFYFFLHTSCSLIPGDFSYWAGIGWNILFFLGCSVLLYLLGIVVFRNSNCGLLAALLFSFSYGGLNTVVFIRMYMLLALIMLFHTYIYLKYIEMTEIPAKGYILLGLSLVAGAITQYYFLIFAFFFGIWYTLKFICAKRYTELGRYLFTIIVSAACSLAFFPAMWNHIFMGGRGEEARQNLISISGIVNNLKIMWNYLDSQMFSKMLIPILLGLFILFLLCYRKSRKINKELGFKILQLLFVCAGYFILITKIAPYQIDRYLMPIYPLVYLMIVGSAYKLLSGCLTIEIAAILCIVGFGGLSCVHLLLSEVSYTYETYTEERRSIAENYGDSYTLYICDKQPIHKYYDVIQVLKEYKGFYYISDTKNTENVEEDMARLEDEEQVILYLDNTKDIEELKRYLGAILPQFNIEEYQLIHADASWKVYQLQKRIELS